MEQLTPGCEKCGLDHKTGDHAAAVLFEQPEPKALHPSDKKKTKKGTDFAKLTLDMANALKAATDVFLANREDGGTSNLDGAVLDLPRVSEEKVIAAVKAAGGSCYKLHDKMWKGCFKLGVPRGGQGNSRTRQAEAMEKSLKAAGWNVSMFYKMD